MIFGIANNLHNKFVYCEFLRFLRIIVFLNQVRSHNRTCRHNTTKAQTAIEGETLRYDANITLEIVAKQP